MDPVTLLAIAKSLGAWLLDTLALLLNPKVWLLLVAAAAFGFLKGCEDEKGRFDAFKAAQELVAAVQAEHTKQVNDRNRRAMKEVEDAARKDREEHAARFAALYRRYHDGVLNDPGTGIVPGHAFGSTQPLQPGSVLCFDRDRLEQGVVGALRDYARSMAPVTERLAALVERGDGGLQDSLWWGRWSRQVDICPAAPEATPAAPIQRNEGG